MNSLPNVLTILRFLLVVPIALCLVRGHYAVALGLVVIAGVSDGVDGWLARKFQWKSRFGAIADPLADKTLTTVVFVLLAWLGHVPVWLVMLVLLRDFIILVGALIFHFRFGPFEQSPTHLGKWSTALQIIFLVMVLLALGTAIEHGFPAFTLLLEIALWVVALVVCLSGIDYVITWSRKAMEQARAARGQRAG